MSALVWASIIPRAYRQVVQHVSNDVDAVVVRKEQDDCENLQYKGSFEALAARGGEDWTYQSDTVQCA